MPELQQQIFVSIWRCGLPTWYNTFLVVKMQLKIRYEKKCTSDSVFLKNIKKLLMLYLV